MLRSLQRAAQTAEVNWGPLSLVIAAGSPKHCTQPEKRAAAQSAAEVAETGTASGHLVVLSTIVNKCVQPLELGKGPTKSMCRCAKRPRGTGICSGCNFTCLCTFSSWQPMQVCATAAMSLPILGQQKDALTSLVVALTPGWCTSCRRRMTACQKAGGTSGRNVPVEMSPRMVVSPAGLVTIWSEGEEDIAATSGQVCWAAAIA
jgi:hypothetical protein